MWHWVVEVGFRCARSQHSAAGTPPGCQDSVAAQVVQRFRTGAAAVSTRQFHRLSIHYVVEQFAPVGQVPGTRVVALCWCFASLRRGA